MRLFNLNPFAFFLFLCLFGLSVTLLIVGPPPINGPKHIKSIDGEIDFTIYDDYGARKNLNAGDTIIIEQSALETKNVFCIDVDWRFTSKYVTDQLLQKDWRKKDSLRNFSRQKLAVVID